MYQLSLLLMKNYSSLRFSSPLRQFSVIPGPYKHLFEQNGKKDHAFNSMFENSLFNGKTKKKMSLFYSPNKLKIKSSARHKSFFMVAWHDIIETRGSEEHTYSP